VPKTETPSRPSRTTKRKGKGSARRPGTRARRDLPVMPIAVGGVLLVVLIALVIAYKVASGGSQGVNGQPVANIECNTGEQLATHYHAHLQILYHDTPVPLQAQTGITGTCFYWLHTHDTSGVIHIEAPKAQGSRQFTLGDFFAIWNQPLSKSQVATLRATGSDQERVWVDGQPYTGDPSKIVLRSHKSIVIEIGPPFTDPPPTYTWDTNTYAQ
jgi:hypothetical protein